MTYAHTRPLVEWAATDTIARLPVPSNHELPPVEYALAAAAMVANAFRVRGT